MSENSPDRVVGFTLSGEWGHFRDPTAVKSHLTYPFPPRTTVAGICAAILGYDRDEYYDVFDPEHSSITVVPDGYSGAFTMPIQTLTTNSKGLEKKYIRRNGEKVTIRLPDPSPIRQRTTFQFIRNPSYTIYVGLDDETAFEELQHRIMERKPVYVPSLGISENIAHIEPHGVFTPEQTSETTVDSVVKYSDVTVDVTHQPIKQYHMASQFESRREGRVASEHDVYTTAKDLGTLQLVDSDPVVQLNGDNVVFY